jgi:hypothetical protein
VTQAILTYPKGYVNDRTGPITTMLKHIWPSYFNQKQLLWQTALSYKNQIFCIKKPGKSARRDTSSLFL